MKQFFENMGWLAREWQYAREWRGEAIAKRLETDGAEKGRPHCAWPYTVAWMGVCLGISIVLALVVFGLIEYPVVVGLLIGIFTAMAILFYVIWSIITIIEYDTSRRYEDVRQWWAKREAQRGSAE